MNRLNKPNSAVFLYCWFSIFQNDPGFFFQDYLKVATAVVVLRGVGKTSLRTSK